MHSVLIEEEGKRVEEINTDEEQRKEETKETMKLNQNTYKLNRYYVQKIGKTLL